jgi:hypothetical protein
MLAKLSVSYFSQFTNATKKLMIFRKIQDNIEMNYAKGLIDEEPLPLRGIICD